MEDNSIIADTSRAIIEDAKKELGIIKNFTDNQIRYVELSLLSDEEIEELSGKAIDDKGMRLEAMASLIGCKPLTIYQYKNNIQLNNIIYKIGIGSASRIIPIYLDRLEKGLRSKDDKSSMRHAQSLVLKLLDLRERKADIVFNQQNNYLHVKEKTMYERIEKLKQTHDIAQS